MTLPLQAVN